MLTREIPFLRICLALCLGIISGIFIHPGLHSCIILIIAAISGLILSFFFNRSITNTIFGAAFSFSLLIIGLIMYTLERDRLSELEQEKTTFSGVLTDYPEYKSSSVMLSLKLNQKISVGSITPLKGSMLLYHKKDSIGISLLPGDLIVFSCIPIPIRNKGNPYEFDYEFYMESRGIKYYAFAGEEDILSAKSPSHRKLRYKALIIRNKIISMYERRGITGERLALVSAITLGEKGQLDAEQKQNFIRAGVMHIMAVSGLHAVILSLFVFNILFFLKKRYNLLRVGITVIFLWAFAFVTGLTPSVLRATLMFSFLQAGNLMKRPVNGINSVLASAFVLIMIRPSVIFDAGFLLSYSAVLFIIGFYRDMYNLFTFRYKLADLVWQSAAVTIVAQAGTLPLTIMLFNRFPVWFLLTNVIIVPISSLLIITGCLVPLTYYVKPVSFVLASALDKLTWLTEFLTTKAAALPFSTVDGIGLTISECVLLITAVTLLMHFMLKKPRISPLYPVFAFLIFSIFLTIKNIYSAGNNELIVYNTPGETTLGVKTGKLLNLYTSDIVIPQAVLRHSSSLGLRIIKRPLPDRPLFLKTGSRYILLTDSLYFNIPSGQNIDFLILTGKSPYFKKEYSLVSPGKTYIIITEASPGYKPKSGYANIDNIRVWSVRESGSFIHTL